jgi:hypothetical protein
MGGPDAATKRELAWMRGLHWRFLLPDPRLGRVLYVGPEEPALLATLERSCDSLRVLPPGDSPVLAYDVGARFDLAVLHSPGPATIEFASRVLRPDGWLYCELDRPALLRRLVRSALATRQSAAGGRSLLLPLAYLRSLGLRGIRPFWHYPNFSHCRRVVPLEPAAVGGFLREPRAAGLAGLLRRPIVWTARLGLLPHLVGHLSLIARKDADVSESP